MLSHVSPKVFAGIALLLVSASPAFPCGPYFPNRVLLGGDNAVLQAPVAIFQDEIDRIQPSVPQRFKAVLPSDAGRPWIMDFRAQTTAAEVEDINKALQSRNLSEKRIKAIVARYNTARTMLNQYVAHRSEWKSKGLDPKEMPPPRLQVPRLPDALPLEFRNYFRAASQFHQGRIKNSRQIGGDLLNLPKNQRRYRSTWSAFMIGKSLLAEKPAESIRWFQSVRRLAQHGFVDSLGLASSSFGWEARAQLSRNRFAEAIELYIAHRATGDPTAIASLQQVAARTFQLSAKSLSIIAVNPTARKVLTAYILSQGGRFHRGADKQTVQRWLAAVQSAKVKSVDAAGRFAWAAYQIGEMTLAHQWLKVAADDDIAAHWVQAKLLLRAGNVPEAVTHLAYITRHRHRIASAPQDKTIHGELGTLYLAREQYTEALDTLQRGDFWTDAAYVAERVLTPDELKAYVDSHWAEAGAPQTGDSIDPLRQRIRYLLARRLTRIGRAKEARPYFPLEQQQLLDEYIAAIRKGHNNPRNQRDRAASHWKAACIARYDGMELLGTEVEPDWFLHWGVFQEPSFSHSRMHSDSDTLTGSSNDERTRLRRHQTDPESRYHYRYTATDHAWRASLLMPDESDDTARLLCVAGTWLKYRDPQAADRFYKALVIRCGTTKLGIEAGRRRGFPKIEADPWTLFENPSPTGLEKANR